MTRLNLIISLPPAPYRPLPVARSLSSAPCRPVPVARSLSPAPCLPLYLSPSLSLSLSLSLSYPLSPLYSFLAFIPQPPLLTLGMLSVNPLVSCYSFLTTHLYSPISLTPLSNFTLLLKNVRILAMHNCLLYVTPNVTCHVPMSYQTARVLAD